MRQPKSLDDAKAMFRAEKAKVVSSVSAIAGSRWLLAILATLAVAFATHVAYAPSRLPPIGGLSITQVGLPQSVDFGYAGEHARAAREAAEREDVAGRATSWAETNADKIWIVNAVGLGATLVLLAVNLVIMTRRRRYTKG
jgi:hypothetical protein